MKPQAEMDLSEAKKLFAFPQIDRVKLHSFSLYRLEPNVSLGFEDGVVCLAGANGIGKSTFLSSVNYALTGAVPNPRRKYLSAAAYLKDSESFTREFFDGRVDEDDRSAAAISIDFRIKETSFSLTRGLFDERALRELSVGGSSEQYANMTDSQRDDAFRTLICQHVGLVSFDQFVFLQHFLLTFDESRHLLFWDPDATSQMLYLCFGGDPGEAAKADQLNREMERAGSWGRNLQFQVNNINKRIDLLEGAAKGVYEDSVEVEAFVAEYRAMKESLESAALEVEGIEAKQNSTDLKVNQVSAAVAALRYSYAGLFNSYVDSGKRLADSPLTLAAINDCQCPLCQQRGDHIADEIRRRVEQNICPRCGTEQSGGGEPSPELQKSLSDVDKDLTARKRELEESIRTKERLEKEAGKARDKLLSVKSALVRFEEENQERLDAIKAKLAATDGPVAKNLDALREAQNQVIAQRDEAYRERDKFKDELKKLQRGLEKKYALAEHEFVPSFRRLSELFLGIDLDVSLVPSQATGFKLELEMRGDARRNQHQLSESQRFFIDIALRMALCQFISEPDAKACLLIDTPEGSLDIAYEDRAGEMFARFVADGYDILMTANINSSKLLTTLARNCGHKAMKIVQMTGWTELSDVQREAGDLFQEAFSEIANALDQAPEAKENA